MGKKRGSIQSSTSIFFETKSEELKFTAEENTQKISS